MSKKKNNLITKILKWHICNLNKSNFVFEETEIVLQQDAPEIKGLYDLLYHWKQNAASFGRDSPQVASSEKPNHVKQRRVNGFNKFLVYVCIRLWNIFNSHYNISIYQKTGKVKTSQIGPKYTYCTFLSRAILCFKLFHPSKYIEGVTTFFML